nr:uncharacterized protein LOC111428766 isoform X8 [Onthophagus taurus]
MMGTMSSIKEIMQFCRLCLVKDQVNVSIFEEHGDTRDVKRKISECLPVTVSEEDSLPKKICDGCLYKLELLYQFRTTCVSAEKQLQVWIAELNNSESKEDQDLKLQHSQTSVKEEIFDATDHPDNSEYVIEEQHISYEEGDIPYNESQDDNDDGDATNSSDDEPLAKRRKRFLEEQVQTDDTLKTADNKMAITKLEHESDDENVDDPEPNFVSVGTSDDQQPGPSGLNKMSATTTNAEMPITKSEPTVSFGDTNVNLCDSLEQESDECAFNIDDFIKRSRPSDSSELEQNDSLEVSKCNECGKVFMNSHQYKIHIQMHKLTMQNDSSSKAHLDGEENQQCCDTSLENIEIVCNDIKFDKYDNSQNIVRNPDSIDQCQSNVIEIVDSDDEDCIVVTPLQTKICVKCKTSAVSLNESNVCPTCVVCTPLYISVKCAYCKIDFDLKNSIVLEGKVLCKSCVREKLTCVLCNEESPSLQHLKNHTRQQHFCNFCNKHIINLTKHKINQVTCTICQEPLCTKFNVQQHYRINHKEYYCMLCASRFTTDYGLYLHSQKFHSVK